jgi:hypothetical protein
MSKYLVRAVDGSSREVAVVPTILGPAENALRALSMEISRILVKTEKGGLGRDDADQLGLYVRALRQVRELQKDLASDNDLGKMTGDQLLQLTVQVLLRKLDEEQLRALGQAVLERLKNVRPDSRSTTVERKTDDSGENQSED